MDKFDSMCCNIVMPTVIWIAAFGVLGVMCRYGVDQFFVGTNGDSNFPVSTFLINILGSFLAGLIFVFSERQEVSPTLQVVLLVGFCGGFTTFSSYVLQTVSMLDKGKLIPALAYLTLSPVLGLLVALIPIFLARRFFSI